MLQPTEVEVNDKGGAHVQGAVEDQVCDYVYDYVMTSSTAPAMPMTTSDAGS